MPPDLMSTALRDLCQKVQNVVKYVDSLTLRSKCAILQASLQIFLLINVDLREASIMNGNQYNQYQAPQPPLGGGKEPGHGMAVASLVMGILSLVLWCICLGYIIFAPLGIIFAAVAKKQGSTSGMSTAGLVTSIVSIVTGILYWVVYVLIIGATAIPWMDWMDLLNL